MDTDELRSVMKAEGVPAYRGKQIAEWLYRSGVRSFDEMSNVPEALRIQLSGKYQLGRSTVLVGQRSKDGTAKLLLELNDGARVETVGLPYPDRMSCCVSTQVGCPIGCVFCATGMGGYTRDLTAGEIVDQVLTVQEDIRFERGEADARKCRIDHVTFMGMGEPLLNYEVTVKAMRLLNKEVGIAVRQLTVSTVGFVPGIHRLAEEEMQCTLAVSLHAPTDDLRRRLIPGMTAWSVAELMKTCREYVQRTRRRITFEYLLLDGVNDGVAEAVELARLLHGLNCHVNLIPCNMVSGLTFRMSPREHIQAFRNVLEDAGIQVTQRMQRGSDIDAACGQLRQRAGDATP